MNLDLVRDDDGFHYIKATSLKGLVREQMEWFNSLEGGALSHLIVSLLGKSDETQGKLKFWNLETTSNSGNGKSNLFKSTETIRYSTAVDIDSGIAKDGSLRSFRVIQEGQEFEGKITSEDDFNDDEIALLASAVRAIKHLGTSRTRGKGLVKVNITQEGKELRGRYV